MRELCGFFGQPVVTPGKHAYPVYHETATGTACAVCGARPTLTHVGKLAYCKAHKAEARRAAETMMGVTR
jgi:hypothetical protein